MQVARHRPQTVKCHETSHFKKGCYFPTEDSELFKWPQKCRSPDARLTGARKNTTKADAQLTFPPGESEGLRFCVCVFRFPPEVFQTPEVPPLFSLTGSKTAEFPEQGGAKPDGGRGQSDGRSRGNAEVEPELYLCGSGWRWRQRCCKCGPASLFFFLLFLNPLYSSSSLF